MANDLGRVPTAPGSQASPSAADASSPAGADPSRDRLQMLLDADSACSSVIAGLIERHEGRSAHAIHCSEDEWNEQSDAFAARDAARAALMPTEQDAIKLMFEAHTRLKELGWNDAIYCPKDGSTFDVIEAGSTGIHNCAYVGEWPKGMWLIDGDSPSRPVLYRVTEAEIAAREARRAAFRAIRDSDGSPKGGDATSGSVHDSAGPEGIAQGEVA